jgi:outer membrane immunogenic protein
MNHAMRNTLAAALLGSASLSQVHAADGLYIGAGIGVATVKDEVNTGTLDSDDTSYKAFVGWRFDVIPLIDLAVEAAYTDFGRPSQTLAGQNVQFKLTGASLAGLLIFPLGPLDLYGKAGLMSWRSERSEGASSSSGSGSDPFYGAGVGFYIWKIGIRAEYERFQVKDVDRVDMVSVSALFQF